MRAELYHAIHAALEGMAEPETGERLIRHIDLWNHNVEFIDQESAWERPAVFIEFHPIQWKPIAQGAEYRASAQVSLHVVTDWDAEDATAPFALLDAIHRELAGLEGESFAEFDLSASATNHNHEDMVENIETYTCAGIRTLQ